MKKLALISIIFAFALSGQYGSAPGLGMGLNYTAVASGSEALYWNPANLVKMRDFAAELNILSLATVSSNNSLTWHDINTYFNQDKVLSESEKQEFIDKIDASGFAFGTQTSLNLISYIYGPYGFSLGLDGSGRAVAPRDFFRLMLLPNSIGETYDISDLDVNGYSTLRLSFAYARWLHFANGFKMAVGSQFHLHYGLGSFITDEAEGIVSQDSLGVIPPGSYYSLRGRSAGPGGLGFGLDLAATTQLMDKQMDISLNLRNLVSHMQWSGNPEEYLQIGRLDSVTLGDLADGRYDKIDTTRSTAAFSTALPRSLLAGAAWRIGDAWTLSADYHQGLDESFGNTYTPRLGVGAEYRPLAWLPLRAGLTAGGNVGTLFTLGGGLRAAWFHFDAAFGMTRGIWPTQSTGFVGAWSLRIRM
jgi:hypothetical protein